MATDRDYDPVLFAQESEPEVPADPSMQSAVAVYIREMAEWGRRGWARVGDLERLLKGDD